MHRPPRPSRRHIALATFAVVVVSLGACGGASRSFCDLAAAYQDSDFTGGDDIERRLDKALGALDDLVEAAPDDIVADLITVRDGVEDFVEGREALDASFEAASGRVSAYLDEHCPRTRGGGT